MGHVLLLVVVAAHEALHGGRQRRSFGGIAEDLQVDGSEVVVGVGVELALIFGLWEYGDLSASRIGVGLVAAEPVDGGILRFECAEHVVEGTVLHHQDDDMLELLDSGF